MRRRLSLHSFRLPPIVVQGLLTLATVLAVIAPPLLAAGGIIWTKRDLIQATAPPAYERALPVRPTHDPARRTAVVVLSTEGTESSDFFAPYEVLSRSGAFNVYAVAAERRPVALQPGNLDLIPHYSTAEYDHLVGHDPDLIVVPFFLWKSDGPNPADAPMLAWLKGRTGPRTTLLTICGGAAVAAEAGLLSGKRATTYWQLLPIVRRLHPEVTWEEGIRYVEDGNLIASAGITSGVDASLHTVRKLVGREVAERIARDLNYPHSRFQDDPIRPVPAVNFTASMLSAAFRPRATAIGMVVYDGVSEVALASIGDTYPRTLAARVTPIAAERTTVTTKHGLALLPRHAFTDAPAFDRVLVPGGDPPAAVAAAVDGWTATTGRVAERIHGGAARGAYPYDATLADLARWDSRELAEQTARQLEYPSEHLTLGGQPWPIDVVVVPALASLLGLAAVLAIRARRRGRARAAVRAFAHG